VTVPLQRVIGRFLTATGLGWLPVRVPRGFASGAWWSLYPWTSYWRGTHEPAVQKVLIGLGDIRGWACWDLGAHFGFYSIGLARRVGPQGEVAAFEPNPLSFRRLSYHRRLNRLSWLKLYAAAASDQTGRMELYTYGDLTTTTTHLPYDGETRTHGCAPLAVPAFRLDELVATHDLRPPEFIKIDVEGHGHRALAGMKEVVRSKRPVLLVALHSPQEIDGIFSILKPLGYASRPVGEFAAPEASRIGRDFLFTPPA
jgi:FkbM family methyltransferase